MSLVVHELKDVLARVDNVSLKFGDRLILKPTTIEVRDIHRPGMLQGQVVGILGPSGVGKTQFSRILTGLQKPSTGQVTVHVGDTMRPVEPGIIGMVAQHYPLFAHRTIKGNLLVALEASDLSPKDKQDRIQGYLEQFGLEGKEDSFPVQLSGGQRQRVAIIQALLCSEHFLVMDEPFTGLDPLMKDIVCDLINKVATLHEKNTIFVVAHDIGALVQIADCLWLFGRDQDEKGQPIPGATIKKTYNLIERGLAWQPNISATPAFHAFVDEVKDQFKGL